MAGNETNGTSAPSVPGGADAQTAAAPEDYEHLLEDFSHFAPPAANEVLDGRILAIHSKEAIVAFNYKSEGFVPIEQLQSAGGELRVKVGDHIDVMLDPHGERMEGYVRLSHERAARLKIWDDLEHAAAEQIAVSGRVLGRTKGGLSVDVGVPAFLPASQADPRPLRNLDILIGQDIPVKVIRVNRRRGNAVVSRKLAVEEQANALKAATVEQLHEGAVLSGVVKNLTEYGAFVDLGGIDGLLHITDMTYGRITHPSEMIQPGEAISVVVLKYDPSRERISLGLKQLHPDPWEGIAQRFPPGERVLGRVVNIADYGAFIELEPGVEGLIHVSEMSWSRRMKHPSKVVRVGDQVEAIVLGVSPKDRRISLGFKQLEADPWTTVEQRYSVGSVVEGRVRNMTDFGAFIEIEEGIDGLVHVSDLSWTKRIKHPNEMLRRGAYVQAVILGIDAQHKRLSLGIKQLQPDAWEQFFQQHNVNDVVHGAVCRLAAFGAFISLAEGVEGLCHFSEIPGYSGRKNDPPPVRVGEEFDFKIIRMNEGERKIGLSLKAMAHEEERSRFRDYQRQAAAATSGMEDYMTARGSE